MLFRSPYYGSYLQGIGQGSRSGDDVRGTVGWEGVVDEGDAVEKFDGDNGMSF